MFTVFASEITIRPDDIDLNNHVHHTKYLDYVLAARYIQMKENYKMAMSEFHKLELNWLVSTTHIDYKRALKLEDKILVKTKSESANGAQSRVLFWIVNKETNKVAAEGYIIYTLISMKTGKPVRIPEDVIQIFSV